MPAESPPHPLSGFLPEPWNDVSVRDTGRRRKVKVMKGNIKGRRPALRGFSGKAGDKKAELVQKSQSVGDDAVTGKFICRCKQHQRLCLGGGEDGRRLQCSSCGWLLPWAPTRTPTCRWTSPPPVSRKIAPHQPHGKASCQRTYSC